MGVLLLLLFIALIDVQMTVVHCINLPTPHAIVKHNIVVNGTWIFQMFVLILTLHLHLYMKIRVIVISRC